MRLLMLTQKVDRDDWLLGFTHGWVEALARHPRVERVEVVCLELGAHDLPPNVHIRSMGRERGYGRLRVVVEAQRAVRAAIGQVDVVLAHMVPRYALVAAPCARLRGVPLALWYVHRSVSLPLRLAHALADRVLTASPESFTLPSRKLAVLGHGIDLARFSAAEQPPGERLVLAVGRLSPIKHYEALIEAAARLAARPGFEDVRFAIAGGETVENPGYGERLRALARERGVADRVALLGPLPPGEMPALYRRAAVTTNLCPTGGLDKAVIESLASGVPAVVRNRTFLPVLGDDSPALWVEDLDPERVADRLAGALSLPPDARAALGGRLAERARAGYGLDGFIERLVAALEETVEQRARPASRRGEGQP